MKAFPQTPETLAVAERVVWLQNPRETLANPIHFLPHVMTFGTMEDLRALQEVVDLDDYREALEKAPAGVFDPRSWAYWNLICDHKPCPHASSRV